MKKKRKKNGYSLIEIMVAMSLFVLEMLIVLSIFQSVNEAQKSAVSAQNIQENLRYTLEVMSKEIRQAVRSDNSCAALLGISGTDYLIYNQGAVSGINIFYFKKIKSGKEICVYYYLDGDRLYIYRHNQSDNSDIDGDFITPDKIKITNLIFSITDNTASTLPADKIQPRVNLRIRAEMITSNPVHKQPIVVQTTVSSRSYGDDFYIL